MTAREAAPTPEGLRAMDDLDRWWERHITATYLRWVEKYPHLFPTHGDTDPPGRSGTAGRIAIAGRGETFPHLPSLPVPVAPAGDPHAAEAAPRLAPAGTPRPIRAARGAAHTREEAPR